jgi:hypothetical protein
MPAVEDKDSIEHACQAHILKVMELMGCVAMLKLPQNYLFRVAVNKQYNLVYTYCIICTGEYIWEVVLQYEI